VSAPRVVAAVALAALLAACGGGGRLDRRGFARDAGHVCRHTTNAAAIHVPPFTETHAAIQALRRVARTERALIASLRDVKPPKSEADAVDAWLALIDQRVDELDFARDALLRGEIGIAFEAAIRADILAHRARAAAEDLDVTPCRLAPIPPTPV